MTYITDTLEAVIDTNPIEVEMLDTVVNAPSYTKTEIDTKLFLKADKATTYTKTETDTALNLKADKATTYTKTETDTALNLKADKSTTYTKSEVYNKTEVNNALNLKADKSNTYTKAEVNTALANKQNTLYAGSHITISGNTISSNANTVSVDTSGSAQTEVKYITIDGTEYKLAGGDGAVSSVNGKTGAVILNASDVGALPSSTAIPTKTSDLTNDGSDGTHPFLTAHQSLSAYRTASAQDTIDNTKADKSTTYTKTEVNDLLDDKADVEDIPNVIDNTSSTSTTDALSANMGKTLNDRINNINVGRFLSFWNCATGMPLSNPSGYPYTYTTSDYFIVSNVASEGGANYMPNGAQYTGEASTTVYTGSVKVNDIFRYDSIQWILLSSPTARGNVVDVQKNGTTVVDAQGIANVTVPTTLSALTNDVGYQTSTQVQSTVSGAISSHNSDSTAHSDIRTAIPTKTSDITNDSGFITSSALSPYRTSANQDTIDNAKADKVTSATSGNLASLNASGNLQDSGKKASDFVLSADISEYTAAEVDALWEATNEGI